MNHQGVAQTLRRLARTMRELRVLADDSSQVLDDAASEVEASYQRFRKRSLQTHHVGTGQLDWGFDIRPESPLRFVRADHVGGHRPEVDLHGTMRWDSEDGHPEKACIVLRVWSRSEGFFYREDWDAERFCDLVTRPENAQGMIPPRRVLLRLHFDLKTRCARDEPLYHLHVGGQAQPDELCWLPNIDNPRIPFVPVDLLLACEIVIADLYPDRYSDLTRVNEWRYLLRQSQDWLLKPYLEECLSAMNSGTSWLQHAHSSEYRLHGD
jgi:hypothetical protein